MKADSTTGEAAVTMPETQRSGAQAETDQAGPGWASQSLNRSAARATTAIACSTTACAPDAMALQV